MSQPPAGPPLPPGGTPPPGGSSGGFPPSGPSGFPGSGPAGPPGPQPSPSPFGGAGSAGPAPSGPGGPRPGDPNLVNGATTHGVVGQKGIRHPWELPLLGVGIGLTVLGYVGWIALMISTMVLNLTDRREALTTLWDLVGFFPIIAQLVLVLPLFPIIAFWSRAIMYAQLRASAVRMSPTQFPEGYRMVVEAAEKYGMRRVPDAYVLTGGGEVNAFAAGHGLRRFVTVYSDMFEIGGEVRDPEALRFVVGHEVGHLAAGHVSYFRLVFTSVIRMIPVLGPALSRSQEYTADNFGYSYAPSGAPGVVGVLSAGKYLNAEVNVNEVADRAATDPSFFVHWVNWFSSHPVITWRAHALRDRSKPGSLWIRPAGALFTSPLPPGSAWSSRYPTPGDALGMLASADRLRPAGAAQQWGRFPGADYSGRPGQRQIQTAAPQLGQRTSYVIPPGPYRDDARGTLPGAPMNPFGPTGQQPPFPPRG